MFFSLALFVMHGPSELSDNLREYQARRDFSQTAEPSGARGTKTKDDCLFVLQRHKARADHYDFRIEIKGVLVSWAVPKGLPKRVGQKHLAIRTENHPLEYAHFQGTIAKGQYGAGTVAIVDRGTYSNVKSVSMTQSLRQGKIEICLAGKKVKGCYALIKTGFSSAKDWLIIRLDMRVSEAKKKRRIQTDELDEKTGSLKGMREKKKKDARKKSSNHGN